MSNDNDIEFEPETEYNTTGVSKEDNDLLSRIVDLELRFKQDESIIKGYRTTINRLNEDLRAAEYNAIQLQESQREVFRLRKELAGD